jgi:antitoxin CptB
MAAAPPPADVGRLAWRCRRGMKELDLLLNQYLAQRWPQAEAAERAAFEHLLELPDPLLAAYLMQRETPADPTLQPLLAVLRNQAAAGLAQPTTAATAPGSQRA